MPTAEVKDDISYEEYRTMKEQGNLQDSPPEPPEEDPEKPIESEEQPDSNAGESSDQEIEIEEEPELYNGKPPTDSQKRFKQLFGEYTPKDLAAKRKAFEEENAALRARLSLEAQQQRQPEQRPQEAPKPETFRARPKLDDYKTVEEWQNADTQWFDDREEFRDQQKRKREQAEAQHRQVQTRQQKAVEQISAGRREYRDFDVVFTAPISDAIAHKLLDRPDGYKTAYALAKNPSEAQRISALSPEDQLIELGVFMANAKPQPKKNSQPLKTPPKLSSGGGAQMDSAEKRIRDIQARVKKMR